MHWGSETKKSLLGGLKSIFFGFSANKKILSMINYMFAVLLIMLLIHQLRFQSADALEAFHSILGHKFQFSSFLFLIILMALMLLNWSIETCKWKLLYSQQRLKFCAAFKAVFAGVTFSMFTPNRIGEYGGRAAMLHKSQRLNAVFANLIGSMAQWMILFFFGCFSLFMLVYKGEIIWSKSMLMVYLLLASGISLSLFFLYFNLGKVVNRLKRFRVFNKFPFYSDLEFGNAKKLWLVLLLSLLRYGVYTLQYLMILLFLEIPLDPILALLAIAVVFLMQTGLPVPPSTGLIARGNIALYVFGLLIHQDYAYIILAATFSLWLINILIPAAFGVLFFFTKTKNLLDENQMDDPLICKQRSEFEIATIKKSKIT